MAAITAQVRAARTREATVLGRLATTARASAPGAGRWLRQTATRARSLALHVTGLGAISAAGWEIARPLGLVSAGVSLLVLEYLSTPSERQR